MSDYYDNDPLKASVVAFVPFNGDFADETGRPWTPAGDVTATAIADGLGKGDFDGSSDFVYTAHDTALDPATGDFTIDAFIELDTLSGIQTIAAKRNAIGDSASGFAFAVNGAAVGLNTVGSGDTYIEGGSLSIGVLHHVEAVYTGGSKYVFVDGQLVASGSVGSIVSNTQLFYIGRTLNAGRYPNGRIIAFRVTAAARHTSNFVPPALPEAFGYTPAATYNATPNVTSIAPGHTITFDVDTTGVADSTTLYYDLTGTVTTDDVVGGSLTGSFVITSAAGQFTVELEDDATVGRTIIAEIYTDAGLTALVDTADTVTIVDPNYAVTFSPDPADEGDTVTATITCSGVPDGTVLAWNPTLDGTAVPADIEETTGGTLTINSGTGSFQFTVAEDFATEGEENLIIELLDEAESVVLATLDPLTINDTSTPASYTFTQVTKVNNSVVGDPASADEGDTVTMVVTVDPVPTGMELRFSVVAVTGSVVAGTDYTSDSLVVPVNETTGVAEWSLDLLEDQTTEGEESFYIKATPPTEPSEILAQSSTIIINDTSTDPATWDSITPDVTDIDEGETVTFTILTSNVEDGTVAYWYAGPQVEDADFVGDADSGTVTITDNQGTIQLTAAEDLKTEGDETFDVAVYSGPFGELGTVKLLESVDVTIKDTSLTPPGYDLQISRSQVGEGESVTVDVFTDYVVEDELYYTVSGTAAGADFSSTPQGTINLTAGDDYKKTGQVTFTLVWDESIEGDEYFIFELRTGSTSGPIVATSAPITILDEQYSVAANRTILTEGQAVTFTVTAVNASPSDTHAWILTGSVDSADFVEAVTSGTVTLSGGVGTITLTLAEDATADGGEFFYLELRRDTTAGAILAVSPAVVTREAAIDYDAWLGSLDGTRILLVEMQHSAGWVYFGNYPYTSYPDDTNPHRPYDDLLWDAVDIETRMDGVFTVGEVAVVNDGGVDAWATYDFRGYPIRFLLGEPDWSLDDFRLVALATNGGIDGIERGLLRFAAYDAKAIFAQPLQTTLLADGTPVPIAIGKPFNVAPALIDRPTHEYQVHEGAIISVTPRDNGADVASTDTLGAGTFELSAAPQGNVAADVVTSIQTPSAIISWLCSRYSVSVDGDTLADLPEYDIGLYYDSQASGADVLNHVCQSIGGYWLRGASGTVEVYILEEPDTTPDLILEYPSDIAENGLRLIATEDPVKTLTLNYKRNWSPVSRDSIAGSVITGDPDFADSLTEQWRSVSVTNTVTDHPLAQDRTINTYLTDPTDAATEAARIADLVSARRERWEVEAFISQAGAQVGKTVQINYPGWGFESGRNARIVSVSRALSRGRVILEVWL